jgi:hypothetical protein
MFVFPFRRRKEKEVEGWKREKEEEREEGGEGGRRGGRRRGLPVRVFQFV